MEQAWRASLKRWHLSRREGAEGAGKGKGRGGLEGTGGAWVWVCWAQSSVGKVPVWPGRCIRLTRSQRGKGSCEGRVPQGSGVGGLAVLGREAGPHPAGQGLSPSDNTPLAAGWRKGWDLGHWESSSAVFGEGW